LGGNVGTAHVTTAPVASQRPLESSGSNTTPDGNWTVTVAAVNVPGPLLPTGTK
jgi:hypothetical protein